MVAVRYAALVALVVWLGGMIVLGLLVAPTTFRALEAADPVNGRVLAGAVFSDVLHRFHLLGYLCGGLLVVTLFVMKFVGPPPRDFRVRVGVVAIMLAVAVYSGVSVSGELDQLQSQASAPISRLAPSDPLRLRFDRVHRTSTVLMTVNIGLGVLLLYWYVRE